MHEPVLPKEVFDILHIQGGDTFVDGTAGGGGHLALALACVGPSGRVIGCDRDPEAVARCRERFKDAGERVRIVKARFSEMKAVLEKLGTGGADQVLLDLGVSQYQLKQAERGFSFQLKGPLDMRMDPTEAESAGDLLQHADEEELADIIWKFGEEHLSRRIARHICLARTKKPLRSTEDLAQVIEKAIGRRGKRHPATKTFQALRIYVNHELDELNKGLETACDCLKEKGRLAVIAYHSLEDRIVKQTFKVWAAGKKGVVMTKKPVVPTRAEIEKNPSARSAKLRVFQKGVFT